MNSPTLICKNCGHHFEGNYCSHCGEKKYNEKDKTVAHFFEDAIHFITHFEGSLFTTIKTMLQKPGKLSLDYCGGTRKRYFKPLSLFLILVIVYLLFPYFRGLNMEMNNYAMNALYGKFADNEIHKAMLRSGLNEEQLSLLFRHKSATLSKFLLIVIIPFSALFLKAILFRRKKYFFDYLIYATEVNSIYILWGFLLLPFLLYILSLFGIHNNFNDSFIGIVVYGFLFIYLIISSQRFFSLKWFPSILAALSFLFAHLIIVLYIYKFLLFYLRLFNCRNKNSGIIFP